MDLDQELEDMKAIRELEKGSSAHDEEEENEVRKCELSISQVSHLLCAAQHPLPLHQHRRTQHPDYLVIAIISALWP